jgi:hypothetical protein
MRKAFTSGILILGLVLGAAAPAKAELGRTLYGKSGTWTLGGELAFDVDWSKQHSPTKVNRWDNQYRVDVFPELGYTFLKGFEGTIGPRLTYMSDADENTATLYGGTISAWYHYPLTGTLYLSTGLRFSMALGKTKVSNIEQDILDWMVGPRFGLTLSFGGKFGGFVRLALKYDFGGQDITTGTNTAQSWIMDLGVVSTLGLFF